MSPCSVNDPISTASPAPPPPKRRSTIKNILLVGGAIFVLLTVVGVIESALGVGDKKASRTSPQHLTATTARPTLTSRPEPSTSSTTPATVAATSPTTTTEAPTTTTVKPTPKPKQYSGADKAMALTLGAGLLHDVQTHNDVVTRDAQLGLASQVMADCRLGYLAVPGWRDTLAGIDMPADIKAPMSRGIDETEAAYKTCVAGDFTATKMHWNAAYVLFQQSTTAMQQW